MHLKRTDPKKTSLDKMLPVEPDAGLHAGVLTGLAVEGEEVHLALVREVRDLRVVDDASDCGIVHTLRIRSNFCFQVL